jgi:hypothetical protein
MLEILDDEALREFGLGGNPGLLLLESPMMSFPINFAFTVSKLRSRGFRRRSPYRPEPGQDGRPATPAAPAKASMS